MAPLRASNLIRRDRMEPLWSRVDRNRLKVAALILALIAAGSAFWTGLLALALFLVAVVARDEALLGFLVDAEMFVVLVAGPASFVLSATRILSVLAGSQRRLLARFGAERVAKGELLDVKYTLKDMAIAAGLEHAPQLYVIETRNVNAFVLGRRPDKAVIGVTRGFAEKLPRDEQRAVFANLMAKLTSGDSAWATTLAALLGPVWRWREADLDAGTELDGSDSVGGWWERTALSSSRSAEGNPLILLAAPYFIGVLLSEFLASGHRGAVLAAAEKADAEGMLLLKDPRAMLRALESSIRTNNFVGSAGPAYGQLFFTWTGHATNDESDPDNERLARLREVLGVEGWADEARMIDDTEQAEQALREHSPPAPPRLGDGGERSA